MSWWQFLRGESFAVRTAVPEDRAAVTALLARAWRRHGNQALDDQAALLANGLSQVALTDGQVVGFLGLAERTPAGAPPQTWVDVEMAAVEAEQPAGQVLRNLLESATGRLRQRQATGVVCLTAVEWLREGLLRAGFAETDLVITYTHDARPPLPSHNAGVQLRPATTDDDADTILALNAAAFTPLWRYQDATLLHWLLTCDHAVLAQLDGRPAGFSLTTNALPNSYAHLIRVATHPAVQGRGIGRQLVVDALRHARETGAPGLALNTQASNTISRHLYESLGFRRSGQSLAVLIHRLTAPQPDDTMRPRL